MPPTIEGLDTRIERVLPALRDHAAATDATGNFPLASLRALRDAGLLGLLVPEEHGGLGGDLRDVATTAQRLAGGCVSTAFAWAMHCQQVDALVRFGDEALCKRLFPRIAQDGYYLGSVTSEAATGGKLLQADEALQPVGVGYRLVRRAPVVTGGRHADGFLVKMRSGPAVGSNDVTLVYVDRAAAEVEVTSPGWDSLGMRGAENVSLTLSATVPPEHLVGGLNGFRTVVVEAFSVAAHVGWSACWLGAARACFSALVREVRAGRLRGVDPASELSRHRLAAIRSRIEVVGAYLRCVVDEVARHRAAGTTLELPAVQIHINTLKVVAARETRQAVDEMIDLAGIRTGYLRHAAIPLERVLRDLRAASLTYDDALLLVSNGSLALLDPAVRSVGDW